MFEYARLRTSLTLFPGRHGIKSISWESGKYDCGWGYKPSVAKLSVLRANIQFVHADSRLLDVSDSPHYLYARAYLDGGQVGRELWREYIRIWYGPEILDRREAEFISLIEIALEGSWRPRILVRRNSLRNGFYILDGAHRYAISAAISRIETQRCYLAR